MKVHVIRMTGFASSGSPAIIIDKARGRVELVILPTEFSALRSPRLPIVVTLRLLTVCVWNSQQTNKQTNMSGSPPAVALTSCCCFPEPPVSQS